MLTIVADALTATAARKTKPARRMEMGGNQGQSRTSHPKAEAPLVAVAAKLSLLVIHFVQFYLQL